jgi:hypothetical protein
MSKEIDNDGMDEITILAKNGVKYYISRNSQLTSGKKEMS